MYWILSINSITLIEILIDFVPDKYLSDIIFYLSDVLYLKDIAP